MGIVPPGRFSSCNELSRAGRSEQMELSCESCTSSEFIRLYILYSLGYLQYFQRHPLFYDLGPRMVIKPSRASVATGSKYGASGADGDGIDGPKD